MIKKLIWLIKNQEQIEKLLKEGIPKKDNKGNDFSIAGVPEFQKEYVNDLLKSENK